MQRVSHLKSQEENYTELLKLKPVSLATKKGRFRQSETAFLSRQADIMNVKIMPSSDIYCYLSIKKKLLYCHLPATSRDSKYSSIVDTVL